MKELVFPFREGKNFTRLSSEHIIILYFKFSTNKNIFLGFILEIGRLTKAQLLEANRV